MGTGNQRVTKAGGGAGLRKNGTRFNHRRAACQWMRAITPRVIKGMPKKARRNADDVGLLTDAIHMLGRARTMAGAEPGLAQFDEVAALAAQHEAHWLAADVIDSRGRAHAQFGRIDDAVRELLAAADAFTAIGDDGSAGGAELFAARSLVRAERPEDAVAIYRAVVERSAAAPGLRQVAALELGDVLEGLGRHGEAAQAREAAGA